MAKGTKAEQRKRMMLMVLGGLFVVVLVYQLFLSSPSKPTRKTTNSNSSAPALSQSSAPQSNTSPSSAGQQAKPKAAGQPEEIVAYLMQDLTPLDLHRPVTSGPVKPDEERGNVFEFAKPPPPPPQKVEPPPPITLTGVNPASAVAGTPRKITLTIVGSMIPEDAQLFFNGSPRKARRLNEHQMATDLEPGEYASAGSFSITVKSASDPKMFSTATTFTVQQAPEPQFRYIGRLGEVGIFEIGPQKEIKRLSRGEAIQGQWRIDAINDQGVELTNVQYEYKRRVPLTEKTK